MTSDLVEVIIGTGSVMAAVGGIALTITKSWVNEMREDIKSVQNLDTVVASHTTELAELNRRLSQLEGGISSRLSTVEQRLSDLKEAFIRLEAAMQFKREIQGMIGRRQDDRE